MACQDDDYEAPVGYSDRELPHLTVDTRTRRHRGRFDARQFDHPQQTLPNADQWPSECAALPLAASAKLTIAPRLLHEVPNKLRDLIGGGIEREMAGIENVYFSLRHILAIAFRFTEVER